MLQRLLKIHRFQASPGNWGEVLHGFGPPMPPVDHRTTHADRAGFWRVPLVAVARFFWHGNFMEYFLVGWLDDNCQWPFYKKILSNFQCQQETTSEFLQVFFSSKSQDSQFMRLRLRLCCQQLLQKLCIQWLQYRRHRRWRCCWLHLWRPRRVGLS